MNDPHPKDGQSLPMAGNNLAGICGVRPEFIQITPALPVPEHIGGSEGGEVAPGISRESVIRMARESGLTDPDLGDWMIDYGHAEDEIMKFVAMVAAAEREACAKLCIEHPCEERSSRREQLAAAILSRGSK